MQYSRINLEQTNYVPTVDCEIVRHPNVSELQEIYRQYCAHKKFKSVMPIFDSEFFDTSNDVMVYKDGDKIVAFSLLRRYDDENVEAIQFAWDYANPSLRLGIESLKSECAYYKKGGYKYLYLGQSDSYKSLIDGYEVLSGYAKES